MASYEWRVTNGEPAVKSALRSLLHPPIARTGKGQADEAVGVDAREPDVGPQQVGVHRVEHRQA